VNITGVVSKQKRARLGSIYVLTLDVGVELAISMSESKSSKDDDKVLAPFVGKRVEAEGVIQRSAGTLLAYSVRETT
jgi:hypothetical protein